jgi:hypothetical protein
MKLCYNLGVTSALPRNPRFCSGITVITVRKPLLMKMGMAGIFFSGPALAQHPSHAKCGANSISVLNKQTNKHQCVKMIAQQRQKQTRALRDKMLRLREMQSQSPLPEKELRRRQSQRQAEQKMLQAKLKQRQARLRQQSRRLILDARQRQRTFQQQLINRQLRASKAQQQQQLQQPEAERQARNRKQVQATHRQTETLRNKVILNRRRVLNQLRELQ